VNSIVYGGGQQLK